MIISDASDRYRKLFGHHPFGTQPFESAMQPYEAMQACLADPSTCVSAVQGALGVDVLNATGLKDFTLGTQYLVHRLVTVTKTALDLGEFETNGVLGHLSGAVEKVMQAFSVPAQVREDFVQKALLEASFGAGMQVLGAIGPVGKVVAAIIGFGVAIGQTIAARNEAAKKDRELARRIVFARMPPLQQPSEQTETWYVNSVLLPLLERGSWTKIFSPRFDAPEWVGLKRNGGYAFAPGELFETKDQAGEKMGAFRPGEGVGLIPGLDEITSVIQVSLDPLGNEVAGWQKDRSSPWPIEFKYVVDVGRFYVNTGRLASVAWAWATQQDQSLDLYKLDVPTLHRRWKTYCDGGLKFLTDNAVAWETGKLARFDDARYLYGSAIGCAIGSWRCYLTGGTTYHPTWGKLLPGHVRSEMGRFDGLEERLKCVMTPNLTRMVAKGETCLVSMYDTHIKGTLDAVRKRQEHYLRHSLACAYVRSSWDAFADKPMAELLNKMRAALIEHPDRMLVDLDDVPVGERWNGRDWKDQLRAAGVKARPPALMGIKARPGTIESTGEPPPKVPESGRAMPFGEPERCGRECADDRRTLRAAAVLGSAALASGAGFYFYRRHKARQDGRAT